jgi:hypothetical protein
VRLSTRSLEHARDHLVPRQVGRYNIATDEDMKAAVSRIEQGAEHELGEKATEESRVDAKKARAQLGQDLDTLYSESGQKKKGPTGKCP